LSYEVKIRELPKGCPAYQNGSRYAWEVITQTGGYHGYSSQAEDLDSAVSEVREEIEYRASDSFHKNIPEASRSNVDLVDVPDKISKTEILGLTQLTDFTEGGERP